MRWAGWHAVTGLGRECYAVTMAQLGQQPDERRRKSHSAFMRSKQRMVHFFQRCRTDGLQDRQKISRELAERPSERPAAITTTRAVHVQYLLHSLCSVPASLR